MSQVYLGQVRDGVVVFENGPIDLPQGTQVVVNLIPQPSDEKVAEDEVEARVARTRTFLLKWANRAESAAPSLPSDLAEHHDHYAHGKPKE
jgi:hypothetical protein